MDKLDETKSTLIEEEEMEYKGEIRCEYQNCKETDEDIIELCMKCREKRICNKHSFYFEGQQEVPLTWCLDCLISKIEEGTPTGKILQTLFGKQYSAFYLARAMLGELGFPISSIWKQKVLDWAEPIFKERLRKNKKRKAVRENENEEQNRKKAKKDTKEH